MPSGRKTLKEELKVMDRYAQLAPKYFKVINDHLESRSKEDRQWAVERLDKAFSKFVPQTIKGPGEDGQFTVGVIMLPPKNEQPRHTLEATAQAGDSPSKN